MRERTVKRYLCDHCGKGFWRRKKAERHENICGLNPNRSCSLCRVNSLDFTAGPILDLVMESGFDVADVMRAASGCPLCTLATVMRINLGVSRRSEEYFWFDYKEEVKKFEDARQPIEVPF